MSHLIPTAVDLQNLGLWVFVVALVAVLLLCVVLFIEHSVAYGFRRRDWSQPKLKLKIRIHEKPLNVVNLEDERRRLALAATTCHGRTQ